MGKPDESREQGRKSISEVLCQISLFIIVFIFPPFLVIDDEGLDNDVAVLVFGLSSILYMLVDPLFLYVPLINEETKCVMLDNRLKIAAIVLRSFGDLRYVQRIYVRIKDGLQSHSLKKVAIDTVSILPVPHYGSIGAPIYIIRIEGLLLSPLSPFSASISFCMYSTFLLLSDGWMAMAAMVAVVVILIFLPKMRGSRSLKIMKFLNSLILLQYLPRLYPIYKMCKQVNKDKVLKAKINILNIWWIPKWFAIAVNISGYIIASHVLGAFWYFFSIQREIDCWGYACRIENGCEFSTSYDENTFRNITLLKNLCPINPPDATIFDFGIFLYALQSGMQASTNFPGKFLQCFLWGLRNLSSFASNLNTSSYGWENFFVVVIAIIGLILFMYLLGHTQTFMQAADKSSMILQKMNIIKPKITYMAFEYGLSNYHWRVIEGSVQQILEDDENVVVQNIFSVLRPRLQKDIKFCLCGQETLSKTHLGAYRTSTFKMLCAMTKMSFEYLEQVSYTGGSYIIREGEPLDMIFFIALGNVMTYSTMHDGSSGSSTTIELKKFEWYGQKDLFPWAARSSSNLSNLPISTITVKSHKQVDISAIKATDLKNIASKFPGILNMEVHHSTDSTGQMEIDVENS